MPSLRQRALLAAIICVAAFVRLFDLSLMELRHDSAFWAIEAQRILNGGYWPLIGQQVGSVSVPLFNGPLLSYLTALVFWVGGPDPRLVAALIACANVIGVWLTYRLGQLLYAPSVGLIAAGFMAVAPWFVLHGRMLWPQSLLPLVVPLLFLCVWRGFDARRSTWFGLTGVLIGLGVQLHLSVLPFAGLAAAFVFFGAGARSAAALIAGGALGYAPVLLHDLRQGFATADTVVRLPALHASSEGLVHHTMKTIWNFTNVLSGQGLWVSKLANWPYLPGWIDWTQGILFSLLFAASLIGLARWRGRAPARARRADLMIVAFAIVPALYLLVAGSQIHRHYFLVLYPLPFLIIARGLQELRVQRPAQARWLSAAAGVGCVLNCVTVVWAYWFLVQYGGQGGYGSVFSDKNAAVSYITAQSATYSVEVAGVQESLPYMFLFGARHPVVMRADHTPDVRIEAGPDGARDRYRLVEPAYHPSSVPPEMCPAFQQRSVVVLRPCEVAPP